ncbi:MAG TPA: hypothetical protein PK299_15095 [Anaerolineales bacterium]|nr:hypothetical protein [Anaerolineales bacterium]
MHKKFTIISSLLLSLAVLGCTGQSGTSKTENVTAVFYTPVANHTPSASQYGLGGSTPDEVLIPYLNEIALVLQQPVPIRLLKNLSAEQELAQQLAVRSGEFQQSVFDPLNGAARRAEIFGVYPLRESDLAPVAQVCSTGSCYRVEMFNYAKNLTVVGIVNVTTQQLVQVQSLPDFQPDVPDELVNLAIEIARKNSQVQKALGLQPENAEAVMPNMKTALNDSVCERSKHLCIAPTFIQNERALWAIIDLTDLKLVGVRWTELGKSSGQPISEKIIQDEVLMQHYCNHATEYEQGDWSLAYMLTSSDGLKIENVTYKGRPILKSAKIVDWHVSYSQTDGFGYSDAIGCPIFSQAAVVAVEPPRIEELTEGGKTVGFRLIQTYWNEQWPQVCNYNYEQSYDFYSDGKFRVNASNLGRGCGNNATYRPVIRIAWAEPAQFSEWNGQEWQVWEQEQWVMQEDTTAYTAEGGQFAIQFADKSGFQLIPNRGQFSEGGRGDNAYTYVTNNTGERDEGESDLITIGPCCNEDYRQGPEKFIEPDAEALNNSTEIVTWYVPQVQNDDTPGAEYCWADSVLENGVYVPVVWKCTMGPMFVPFSAGE